VPEQKLIRRSAYAGSQYADGGNREQRIDVQQGEAPIGRVSSKHDDIAMRHIEETHGPVDQVETYRDERIDRAGGKSRDKQLRREQECFLLADREASGLAMRSPGRRATSTALLVQNPTS
jgi:hypothetical protein